MRAQYLGVDFTFEQFVAHFDDEDARAFGALVTVRAQRPGRSACAKRIPGTGQCAADTVRGQQVARKFARRRWQSGMEERDERRRARSRMGHDTQPPVREPRVSMIEFGAVPMTLLLDPNAPSQGGTFSANAHERGSVAEQAIAATDRNPTTDRSRSGTDQGVGQTTAADTAGTGYVHRWRILHPASHSATPNEHRAGDLRRVTTERDDDRDGESVDDATGNTAAVATYGD